MLEGSCHCGAVHWRFEAEPESVTACNCTVCRRYGVLWIYGHADEDVFMTGETSFYKRGEGGIEFHFCANCGCVTAWRAAEFHNGRKRMAVNLRLAEPTPAIMALPIDHFEGLETFEDLPRDHRTVKDMWF